MVILAGFVLFLALSAAIWFVSVAVYRSLFAGHDPANSPGYRRVAAVAIHATPEYAKNWFDEPLLKYRLMCVESVKKS